MRREQEYSHNYERKIMELDCDEAKSNREDRSLTTGNTIS
jgi:hypothetical protein